MKNRLPFIVLLVFSVLYASVSLVNHFLFRTYALDLGLYTNALYDYSHLQWNDSSSFREFPSNLLSDHFDLLLFLLAPFSFIFKSWTLLVFQWLIVTSGGYAVYCYFSERFSNRRMALMAMLFYFTQFAIFSALSFDYHSNVIAAVLLSWFLLFVERGQRIQASVFLLLVLIAKENMSFWMIFFLTGVAFVYRSSPIRRYLLFCSLFSLLYFLVVTVWVMPALDPSGKFVQFNYSVLGSDYTTAVSTALHQPARLVEALFRNHLGASGLEGVKEEWWKYFLLSGGMLLFIRPVYLWMLLPVFFQKMWSDRTQTWGVNDHYSIELLPVLVWGVFMVIGDLKNVALKRYLMPASVILSLFSTISIMDRTQVFLHREQLRIYQNKHWTTSIDRHAFDSMAAMIPDTATVSVQSCLHPRLAWRDNCYCYPMVKDATFILVSAFGDSYPMKTSSYSTSLDTLRSSAWWKLTTEHDGLLLFVRR